MSYIVVYYSRTGRTRKIGEIIATEANCDSEEIIDTKKRTGFIGFLKSGKDATLKKLATIRDVQKNPELYNLIILGTPIWNKRITPAIRTYITDFKDKFRNVAFFCTEGGSGGQKTFNSMANLCEKTPKSTLEITKSDIKIEVHIIKIKKFIQELKKG